MSLVRRAQLAVTAHIRHEYTNYDKILRSMGWAEARKQVQQACLDILVQWRRDDDDDGELEDILREVIVISDDEDEEEELQPSAVTSESHLERSESVEFVPTDALKTSTIDFATANSKTGKGRSLSPDTDDPDGVEYLGTMPSFRGRPIQYKQRKLEQIEAHRHKMWEEAINRQQTHPRVSYTGGQRRLSPRFEAFDQSQSQKRLQEQQGARLVPYTTGRTKGEIPSAHAPDRPVVPTALEHQVIHEYNNMSHMSPRCENQVSAPGKV